MTTKPTRYFWIILLSLLTACGIVPTPTTVPLTFDPFYLNTTIAQTAGAAATQTFVLQPTLTPMPTATKTPNEISTPTPPEPPEKQPSVIISGIIDSEKGAGSLESMYIIESKPDIPAPGDYAIRFEDNAGQEIITHTFNSEYDGFFEGFSPFTLVLPWDSNTTRIILLKDSVELASRSASANAPEIHLVSPNGGEILNKKTATIQWEATDADGDPLTYIVYYSVDGGQSWQVQDINFPNTKLDLDLDLIKNTEAGLVRVLASDGFHTAQDQSDGVFSIATEKEIFVEILDADDFVFSGGQTVILDGEAYHANGEQLSGDALTWSSDIDGFLGQGEQLVINAEKLKEGVHIITLTARDDEDHSNSDTAKVTIYRSFSSLSIDADSLSFVANQDEGVTMGQLVEIWHLGSHSLTWSATADQNWILLSAASGNTPTILVVSVNPAGLSAGTYTGIITFTSNAEGINSKTVSVTLVVQ